MELKNEQRKVKARGLCATFFCGIVLSTSYLTLPNFFSFPTDLVDRIGFALKASVFILVWLVIAVRLVSKGRLVSDADIRGSAFSAPSERIRIKAAFLQNTLEQAALAIGASLAFAATFSADYLSLVVGAVLLFSIGRLTFYIGYRSGAGGRAFGMVVTMLPAVLGLIASVAAILKQLIGI